MRMQDEDREKATISSQPPMMPIVLDEAAIEDILGVSVHKANFECFRLLMIRDGMIRIIRTVQTLFRF